jgi:protein-tyrosine phosphatase
MEFINLPIPDRKPPETGAEELLGKLEEHLREARNLIVHCRQGIGRSAVVAAAFLILGGVGPEKAIRIVQDARRQPVPETDEQRDWIRRFASNRSVR